MANDIAKSEMRALTAMGMTAEAVYRPAGARPRSINVIVDASGDELVMNAAGPVLQVTLLNDPLEGIDAAALDRGADRLELAEFPGGEKVARGFGRWIQPPDKDWLVVEIR